MTEQVNYHGYIIYFDEFEGGYCWKFGPHFETISEVYDDIDNYLLG